VIGDWAGEAFFKLFLGDNIAHFTEHLKRPAGGWLREVVQLDADNAAYLLATENRCALQVERPGRLLPTVDERFAIQGIGNEVVAAPGDSRTVEDR